MEFGIAVATSTDSWRVVKKAEELGFTDAWFYDTQLINRPEETPFITEELILGSTFSGTGEVLVDHVRRLEDAGYSQFTVQIVPGQESAIEDWAGVFEQV
jgi:alkanesulfonate monooxygenase SsuD/methylene tetrahydromethanopterin reductase-like flavin-dependent oxidoreductase (luciferase family)